MRQSNERVGETCKNKMKIQTPKPLKMLAALLGVVIVASAHATSIPLLNPSFESPVSSAWANGFLPDYWNWEYGSYVESPSAHTGNQGVVNIARAGWFRLSQQSSYTVVHAGEQITAKTWVRISNMIQGTADFELVIDIGGVPVATNTFVVATNMLNGSIDGNGQYEELIWTNFTAQYTTVAGDVGQTVGAAIGNDGGNPTNDPSGNPSYCYMDDVSLETVSTGAPTVMAVATPNPVELYSNVLITATVTPGLSPTITSVVLDASPLVGSSKVSLVSAGSYVYTNTVAASAPVNLDVALPLPVTVTDANTLVGQTNIALVVNRPSVMTWAAAMGTGLISTGSRITSAAPLQAPIALPWLLMVRCW